MEAPRSFENGFSALARKSMKSEQLPLIHTKTKTSTLATGMSLVTTMVGAGILAFPATFKKGGFGASSALLLIAAWASIEIGNAMAKCLALCETCAAEGQRYSFGSRPEKFEDIFEVAFGRIGKTVVGVLINLFLLIICGAFLILIGQSLEFISDAYLPYRAWVLVVSVLFVPLTLLKDMTMIAKLAAIGVFASIMYVVCISHAGISAGLEGTAKTYKSMPNSLSELGGVFGVIMLGFNYQAVVPAVRSQMQTPEEFPDALRGSVVLVGLIYLACGAIGYFGWGDGSAILGDTGVKGNVLQSMVDSEGNALLAGKLLASAVTANLSVTFPIIMNCVASAAESSKGAYSATLRLLLLLVAVAVGLLCPFFLEVVTLLAAVLGVTSSVFLPLGAYWKVAQDSGELKRTSRCAVTWLLGKHVFIAFLGLCTLFVGTYGALCDLQEAFGKPGANPFVNFWQRSS